jgi:hypothetical protein
MNEMKKTDLLFLAVCGIIKLAKGQSSQGDNSLGRERVLWAVIAFRQPQAITVGR